MSRAKRPIIYLGFNDPRQHVRGTENVIRAQAAATEGPHYYVFRSPRFEVFRWDGIVAIGCPVNLLLAGLFLRRLVTRIRRRKGVTPLLHGHSYLLGAVASGAPQVFTVHDGLTYLKRHFGAKRLWPYQIVERWVYGRAAKIHAISRYAWSETCAGPGAKAKLTIIHNSISTPTIDAAAHDAASIPSGSPEYLVVRSIEERANLGLILELARDLLTHEPDACILVAGKGPLLAHFREAAAVDGLTNLHFLGYVSDATLDALYRRATCVIMPALYGEGFGLPLIEAYSRGTPAIGSGVCAVPEVIERRELMFENTLPSLRSALHAARGVPRQAFLSHFETHFSPSRIRESYRSLYDTLAPARSRLTAPSCNE